MRNHPGQKRGHSWHEELEMEKEHLEDQLRIHREEMKKIKATPKDDYDSPDMQETKVTNETTTKEKKDELKLTQSKSSSLMGRIPSKPLTIKHLGGSQLETCHQVANLLEYQHRFLRSDEDDEEATRNWQQEIAKKYHDKLYKEYALIDLSRYKRGQVRAI